MTNTQFELLRTAKEAIRVSHELMAELNREVGNTIAPGPRWGNALAELKTAVFLADKESSENDWIKK